MTSSEDDDGNFIAKDKARSIEEISSWKPPRKGSAFKSFTVLTNLQRGNIETHTDQVPPDEFTFHNKSAMGELTDDDFTPDTDVNEDYHGFTPVMWASFYGQLPAVRLLLHHGAKVDLEGENGETALLLAASEGHHEIVRLLLNFGASPNHVDHAGNTALMYAANDDHAHCISELLENGADITYTTVNGIAAFNIAVSKGCKRAQIVMERFLLRLLEPS